MIKTLEGFKVGTLKRSILLIITGFWTLSLFSLSAQNAQITGVVKEVQTLQVLQEVEVFLEMFERSNVETLKRSNLHGEFRFTDLESGTYYLTFLLEGYSTKKIEVKIASTSIETEVEVLLNPLELNLEVVEIVAGQEAFFQTRALRNVEGVAIYAGKKSEVIEVAQITANLATNNSRQIYKGIPGLNIWESDGAGLQLSIGARGLDPNRTANFNTRQNGYDISADALGYPESYYTPPSQSLQKIEVVRGAASLQYGPQFGGLLNFVLKKGNPHKKVEVESHNTLGSFGLVSSFSSIGGQVGKLNYYTFYQRKQGNGWRAHSKFHQNNAFASLEYALSPKVKVGLEYTFMNYLAQQPGGLMDFEFATDPRQSKRERNWFKVDWNLLAFKVDYKISPQTQINTRSFLLKAGRQALGELGPINRPDPLRERDLIQGAYNNLGNETRLIHRYHLGDQYANFLIGTRIYKGQSFSKQGNASDGADPDFAFLNPDDLERAAYEFPSRNLSVFMENLFYLNKNWTFTPGIRYELIKTASEGYYKEQVYSGGEVIFEQRFEDSKTNLRDFVLLGLGSSYKFHSKKNTLQNISQNTPTSTLEAYANFSQNFRSINFSDLAVVNPNLVVDSLLSDERGYNVDLGLRGTAWKGRLHFDCSLFYLRYKNRIGVGELVIPDPISVERAVAFRTNIGDARIVGLESLVEADITPLFLWNKNKNEKTQEQAQPFSLFTFLNISVLHGRYLSGLSSFNGKQVELIPPISIKTGLNLSYKNLKLAYQYSYVRKHYSDATNSEWVANATRGLIPSYAVHDLSMDYHFKKYLKLSGGINNLWNAAYFTRRANAYPGPGIIPSDGRSFYLSLGVIL